MITNTQLWLAALFPTAAALGSLTVAVITLITNNNRLSSVETHLLTIEADLREFYRVMGMHEVRLDNLEKH